MNVIETALAWIKTIAADDSHGYDQSNRWGPDYDCSSLVISAWKKAGVPLTCTYTGNMYGDMISHDFYDATSLVDLNTGAGLQPGDVLLNHANHTGMWDGSGIVQASSNEFRGVTGGQTGDQTGREIYTSGYYNYPWDCVLRYATGIRDIGCKGNNGDPGVYTVQYGDTYWSIAEKFLGDGCRYDELMKFNGTTSPALSVGQIIQIPDATVSVLEPVAEKTSVTLPELSVGSKGNAVKILQFALNIVLNTNLDVDGEYGAQTEAAVRSLQRQAGSEEDGRCGRETWKAVFNG